MPRDDDFLAAFDFGDEPADTLPEFLDVDSTHHGLLAGTPYSAV